MHDPDYYKTYSDRWTKEYETEIRKYEKGSASERGFEGANDESSVEINAQEQLDAARKEREEKMELTKHARIEGQRQMPNMKINPQKIGGLAGRRHQLSSLLTEAYMNREAIEEKIAQGKRNRKEAGSKYGEFCLNNVYCQCLMMIKCHSLRFLVQTYVARHSYNTLVIFRPNNDSFFRFKGPQDVLYSINNNWIMRSISERNNLVLGFGSILECFQEHQRR